MPREPETPARSFHEEWRDGDAGQRAWAVLKRLAPGLLFVVFMYVFTTFSGMRG